MAGELSMRPARYEDAVALSFDLRPAEADEVTAATGRDPLPVIIEAVRESSEAWAVYDGDELVCLWGVVPQSESYLGGRVGLGWLLAAEVVERKVRAFWLLCLRELPRILERWDMLVNAIDERHEKALRWAKRLGFRLADPAPFGAAGLPFCRFQVARRDLCVHPS